MDGLFFTSIMENKQCDLTHFVSGVPAGLEQQDLPVVLLRQPTGQRSARGTGTNWKILKTKKLARHMTRGLL